MQGQETRADFLIKAAVLAEPFFCARLPPELRDVLRPSVHINTFQSTPAHIALPSPRKPYTIAP